MQMSSTHRCPWTSVERARSSVAHTPSQRMSLPRGKANRHPRVSTSPFVAFPLCPSRSRPARSFSQLRGSIASFPLRVAPAAALRPRSSFSPLAVAMEGCTPPARAHVDATTKILTPRCDRPVVAFVLGSICSPVRTDLASFGCKNGSQTGFRVRSQSID